MIALLNQQLADVLDLGLQAKQAHWNVKGPHFMGLHEMFDKVAEELEEFADSIAERAIELGAVALGTGTSANADQQVVQALPRFISRNLRKPSRLMSRLQLAAQALIFALVKGQVSTIERRVVAVRKHRHMHAHLLERLGNFGKKSLSFADIFKRLTKRRMASSKAVSIL